MGRRSAIFASVFQLLNIFLTMIAYTITGANSIVSIAQIACSYEGKTTEELQTDPSCLNPGTGGIWKMTLAFGGAELLLSQVRNLEEAWWVSVLGTFGSLIYGFVALILSIANGAVLCMLAVFVIIE